MIGGVKVVPLVAHVDDRGYLIEIIRADGSTLHEVRTGLCGRKRSERDHPGLS